MRLATSYLFLLGLVLATAAADLEQGNNTAGYDTSRVGPSNAICVRDTYSLDITSNNIQFRDVDSNANQVRMSHSIVRQSLEGSWYWADVPRGAVPDVLDLYDQPDLDVRATVQTASTQQL